MAHGRGNRPRRLRLRDGCTCTVADVTGDRRGDPRADAEHRANADGWRQRRGRRGRRGPSATRRGHALGGPDRARYSVKITAPGWESDGKFTVTSPGR